MSHKLTKPMLTALTLIAFVTSLQAYPIRFKMAVMGNHVATGVSDDPNQIPWAHLTHLDYFGVGAQPDGSLRSWDNKCFGQDNVPCWTDAKFAQMVQAGHLHDVKVGLTLQAIDDANCNLGASACSPTPSAGNAYQDRIHVLLDHSCDGAPNPAQDNLINNILQKLTAAEADGLEVDIEWPYCSDAADYACFVSRLTNEVHAAIPGSYVWVAAPAWDSIYYPPLQKCDATFWEDLAAGSDVIDIMGYGYHGDFSDPGPVSPVHAGTKWPAPYNLDLNTTLAFYLNHGIPPSKLQLGFPFYGDDFPTDTASVPAGSGHSRGASDYPYIKVPGATAPRWDCERRLSTSSRVWDPVSLTPYVVTGPDGAGTYHQLFCESLDSMAAKFQLAVDTEVAGVFFWAENYLPHDYPIWRLLDQYSMVTPPPNQAAVVSISSQSSVAPNTTVTMQGHVDSNPDGDSLVLQWNVPSGPSVPTYDPGNESTVTTKLTKSGYYTFTFTAADGGATASASTRVLVTGDTTPPAVKITSSIPSAISGYLTVNVSATDTGGVRMVDLEIDGTPILTDTTAPYSFVWNTNGTPDGSHTVRARATDWSDLTTVTASKTTNVDNNPPQLAILSPANGATVSGSVPINLSVYDQSGISKVEFYVNGTLKKSLTRSPWTWTWDSSSFKGQSVVLMAKAYDKRSHTSTAFVTVTVSP